MGYEDACKSAADDQGITAIHEELKRRGINSEVWQTGGFTMVCAIPLGHDPKRHEVRYIGCTADGAGVTTESDDGGYIDFDALCNTSEADANDRPRIIADAVAAFLKTKGE